MVLFYHSIVRVLFDNPHHCLHETVQQGMHTVNVKTKKTVLPQLYLAALKETGATLKNMSSLGALDQWSIRRLRKSLRGVESSLSRDIGYLQQKLRLIAGKTQADLTHIAESAVDVEILNPGIFPTSLTNVGHNVYEYGHSTFLRCGSCKHFASKGCGVKCSILSTFDDEQKAPYDSPCLIRQLPETELRLLEDRLVRSTAVKKRAREMVRSHQKALEPLVDKNVFPGLTSDGKRTTYRYGDRVRVFVYGGACKKSARLTWQPATVIAPSYKTVVCFDFAIMLPKRRTDLENVMWPKHVIWLDGADELIVHEWEYQWLRKRYLEKPNDAFITEWRSRFDFDWWRSSDACRDERIKFPAVRIADELFTGKEFRPVSSKRRLMSAEEACALLAIEATVLEAKDKDVATAQVLRHYRNHMQAERIENTLLQRAKNTLLLRLQGVGAYD